MTGIYMFTNKCTEKSYIGQSINIEKRYNAHLFKMSEKSLFHDELHYYGIHNFDFEILEECSVQDLDDREMYYIKKYNTISPNGYNLTAGGGNSPHLKSLKSFDDVDKIIELLKEDTMTNSQIGALFGISDQMVSDINRGRSWKRDGQSYPVRDKRNRRAYDNNCDERFFSSWFSRKRTCSCCGTIISNTSKTGMCRTCYDSARALNIPSKEMLENELCSNSFESVARKHGVTSNSVRKWCRKYGIPYRASDYKM